VPDVRPYLRHARVVVAPLRVARGIQNKVLEAMAMARPTVVTSGVARALSARPGIEFEVADETGDFADKVVALMDRAAGDAMGRRARARVETDYAWSTHLARFDALLGAPASPRREAAGDSFPAPQPMAANAR
jgi:glycosyltransferase involved in cell wall biosynthesis